jgi:hypothetical protein
VPWLMPADTQGIGKRPSSTIAVSTNKGPVNGGSHSCSERDNAGALTVPTTSSAAIAA